MSPVCTTIRLGTSGRAPVDPPEQAISIDTTDSMTPPPPPSSADPGPAPRVTAAGLDDADAIAELEAAAAHHPWTASQVAAHLGLEASCSWIARIDGVPVGWVLATAVADEGELCSVGTLPAARRRGVARALLDALVAGWRARGVTVAWLEVRVDNVAARALYARTGWSEAGVRRRYYADGVDAVVCRWDASG